MRKRRLLIALAVLVVFLLVGLLVWLRARSAPEAVRLLPECDAVIYTNLQPLRLGAVFSSLPEPQREMEYEEFVRGTGFQFERDLDQAAFAVHQPGSAHNTEQETRFSEVFVGRFNYDRLTGYLRKKAQIIDRYRETDVFTIPVEGRSVRVAILSVNMVAVSNVAQPNVLDSIIDRARQGGLPFGGPQLVRDYYRHVPFGSLGWSVAALSRSGRKNLTLPGGFELPFPPNTTLVASVRFSGTINLKAEAFTPSEQDSKTVAENLNLVLSLFRSMQANLGSSGADPDVKSFFDSIEVKQERNKAVITATLSPGFLKKAMQEAPATVAPPTSQPTLPKEKRRRK